MARWAYDRVPVVGDHANEKKTARTFEVGHMAPPRESRWRGPSRRRLDGEQFPTYGPRGLESRPGAPFEARTRTLTRWACEEVDGPELGCAFWALILARTRQPETSFASAPALAN
jgi:hypothetical protein